MDRDLTEHELKLKRDEKRDLARDRDRDGAEPPKVLVMPESERDLREYDTGFHKYYCKLRGIPYNPPGLDDLPGHRD